MRIAGSVALVTGGNRGIGEAFVHAFVEAGARRVYVGARDPADGRRLAQAYPERVRTVRLDVTDPDQVAEAARACGDVSILVNNAGAFAMRRLIEAPDMTGARLEMETNYFGPLMMCRAFAPALAGNPESAIVNVLSAAAIVAVPGMGGYSPSKFAGRAMSACLRAELAAQKTHVAALIVGSIDTRMAGHVQGYKEPPAVVAAAGLRAIERRIDELDTDAMAVEVRAGLALDPKGQELRMRRSLAGERVTADRGARA